MFKQKRDMTIVKQSLESLSNKLKTKENLLPLIVHCVKNNCTLGEICNTMREVHGEHV